MLLCCWWDAQGMPHWEMLKVKTVTSELHIQQSERSLLRSRKRGEDVLRLCTSMTMLVRISLPSPARSCCGWSVLPHPPYSSDLAPSDYHLFRSLKNQLRGGSFQNYDEVKIALEDFLDAQPSVFWKKGMDALPERWQRVIDTNENCHSVDCGETRTTVYTGHLIHSRLGEKVAILGSIVTQASTSRMISGDIEVSDNEEFTTVKTHVSFVSLRMASRKELQRSNTRK
ncbi:unnamed protein product [Cylicostephanus goldi]|uniref:Uncharacterized protein n=1 Tax=Cylicostephanus goldi TaxID=71465 RepID=A0A3P7LZU4_CYLGO|nr:unnamed protein product [Cylicostephanus goldi]